MIFQSKQTVNSAPLWAVDTDTQTVTHINPKSGETERYVGFRLILCYSCNDCKQLK